MQFFAPIRAVLRIFEPVAQCSRLFGLGGKHFNFNLPRIRDMYLEFRDLCSGRVFVMPDLLSDECPYSLLHVVREWLQWSFVAGF